MVARFGRGTWANTRKPDGYGSAVSYALGRRATLEAAIRGVFVWRKLRSAPAGTTPYIALMFPGYPGGLTLIRLATV